jgi:hypothetical protein
MAARDADTTDGGSSAFVMAPTFSGSYSTISYDVDATLGRPNCVKSLERASRSSNEFEVNNPRSSAIAS